MEILAAVTRAVINFSGNSSARSWSTPGNVAIRRTAVEAFRHVESLFIVVSYTGDGFDRRVAMFWSTGEFGRAGTPENVGGKKNYTRVVTLTTFENG